MGFKNKFNKKECKLFVDDFMKVIEQFNPVKEDYGYFRIETSVGTLYVVLRDDDPEFIPMRFDNNINMNKFLEVTHDDSINKHSYKWNIIIIMKKIEDRSTILAILNNRLKMLTNNNN